jgi:hypothetical protein
MAAWRVEAAWRHDLWDRSYIDIAKGSNYTDFEFAHPERSHSAERLVRQGRELLHDLGAWPWALCERGRLPARWWEQGRFAQALALWFRDATLQCLSDALRILELAMSDEGREPVSRADAEPYGGPTAVSETSSEGARLAYQAALRAAQDLRGAA